MSAAGKLAGRRALVSGGGRGIGRAIALGLAGAGADVIVGYHSGRAEAEAVAAEIAALGRRTGAVAGDVSQVDGVARIMAPTVETLGGLDILVSNAAALNRSAFLEMTPEQFDSVVAVVLRGVFLLGQAAARHMVAQGSGGSIINVSSISDTHAFPGLSHYQAAKAGVTMLTRGMALELAPHRIRVNALNPGVTATDINRGQRETNPDIWAQREARIPLGRAGQPDDHAGAAIFLASDDSAWVTGTALVVDGGQSVT